MLYVRNNIFIDDMGGSGNLCFILWEHVPDQGSQSVWVLITNSKQYDSVKNNDNNDEW